MAMKIIFLIALNLIYFKSYASFSLESHLLLKEAQLSTNKVEEIKREISPGSIVAPSPTYAIIDSQTNHPIAVFKTGEHRKKEAIISELTKTLFNYPFVTKSFYVETFPLGNHLFSGLIEEFIPSTSPGIDALLIPNDVLEFINIFKNERGGLMLDEIFRKIAQSSSDKDRWIQFLKAHLDTRSIELYFLSTLLFQLDDTEPRNIALRLNSNKLFDFVSFDNEHALAGILGRSCIARLPILEASPSEEVSFLIASLDEERLLPYKAKIIEFYSYKEKSYMDIINRLKGF